MPSRVEELISVGKILLPKKGGDLLLQVTYTGQHGSSTQPVNFAKVRNGTRWRNSSHTFRSAVTPRMKTASWAVSFVSVVSPRAREKAMGVEMRVFSESCTLSMQRRMVQDERLTLSKTERSGRAGVSRAGLQSYC